MLIDQAIIYVAGGRGGDGLVSMRREAYVPKGGPDGGDGGDGGSLYLKAIAGLDTLLDMAGHHHWSAENGQPGRGKSCTGRGGEDFYIRVPVGTIVYDDDTGEQLVDLDRANQVYCAARGGTGGFGNEHFKAATQQSPRQATPGEPGEERTLRLELKMIADVGLVGKPNAGKSTLLSRLSAARPKIADYPFTTMSPQLGIVEAGHGRRLVMADLPGLIEGAHEGAGLGHDFLRHIERTRLLVHLVDIDPVDGSDPVENYRVIRRELTEYSQILADKEEMVVLSKFDLLGSQEDQLAAVELFEQALDCQVYGISSASGVGCNEMLAKCAESVRALKEADWVEERRADAERAKQNDATSDDAIEASSEQDDTNKIASVEEQTSDLAAGDQAVDAADQTASGDQTIVAQGRPRGWRRHE